MGDLLFQIVFHARLAEEAGRFTLADVARGVHDKLVHRHPHVFGEADAATADEVKANWEEIKREEKGRSSVTEGIPADLPALLLSTKLQRKALSVGMAGPGHGDARDGPGGDGSPRSCAERSDPATAARPTPPSPGPTRRPGGWSATCSSTWRTWHAGWESTPNWRLRSRALAFRDGIVAREGGDGGPPNTRGTHPLVWCAGVQPGPTPRE